MPDKYGFDHLGAQVPTVRCIWCGCSSPYYGMTENERARHARKHAKDRAAAEAKALEEKALIDAGESLSL